MHAYYVASSPGPSKRATLKVGMGLGGEANRYVQHSATTYMYIILYQQAVPLAVIVGHTLLCRDGLSSSVTSFSIWAFIRFCFSKGK